MSEPNDPKRMREVCHGILDQISDDSIIEVLSVLVGIQEREAQATLYLANIEAERRVQAIQETLRKAFEGLTDEEIQEIIDEPYG